MKLRIAVAFGGESVEHEISILSALQVMEAMDVEHYEIIPLYIAKDGQMYTHPNFTEITMFKNIQDYINCLESVSLIRRDDTYFIIPSHHHIWKKETQIDMVFPILHGTHGEDGTFQGYVATLKIPYIGCGVLGGAIGQDKVIMKQILQDSGLPITPWFTWTLQKPLEEAFFKKAQRLGYPLVIKPASLGSSIGISVVHNDVELHKAMIEAYQYDPKVVIEKAVENVREINCSVLGNEKETITSVLEEVMKEDGILSYENKYTGQNKSKGMVNALRQIPALLNEETTKEIQAYAKQTFAVLNASGVARIDFLMNDEHKEIYVNEINTIPGSLAFYLWEKSDISFPELIDRLVHLALQRVRKEKNIVYSYDTNILHTFHEGSKLLK